VEDLRELSRILVSPRQELLSAESYLKMVLHLLLILELPVETLLVIKIAKKFITSHPIFGALVQELQLIAITLLK
jgi:hypothetical protein